MNLALAVGENDNGRVATLIQIANAYEITVEGENL